MTEQRDPMTAALDALTNCRSLADGARKAVLELLGNLAIDYSADQDLEALRPAFKALDNIDALMGEADAGLEATGATSSEGGAS